MGNADCYRGVIAFCTEIESDLTAMWSSICCVLTMKFQLKIVFLGLLVLAGCVTAPNNTVFDATKRLPTTTVDIFRDGQKPEKPYTEIGELSQEYFVGEDAVVMKGFVETAKKRGADGIIMLPGRDGAYKLDLFGRSGNHYVWHAIMIAWKPLTS